MSNAINSATGPAFVIEAQVERELSDDVQRVTSRASIDLDERIPYLDQSMGCEMRRLLSSMNNQLPRK